MVNLHPNTVPGILNKLPKNLEKYEIGAQIGPMAHNTQISVRWGWAAHQIAYLATVKLNCDGEKEWSVSIL